MLLIPLRIYLIPRLSFTAPELAILDGPTASPFVSLTTLNLLLPRPDFLLQTMESVGGSL